MKGENEGKKKKSVADHYVFLLLTLIYTKKKHIKTLSMSI